LSNYETLIGGNGNDFLTGTEVADVIIGNDGDDTLNGLGGDDILRGGNNNDAMRGGAGNDTMVGDKGSDVFTGGFGDDRMIWNDGDGSDIMRGDSGTDVTEFNGSVAQGDDLVLKADGSKANFQRLNLVPITLDVDDTEQFEINGIGGDDTLNVKDLSATDVQQVKFKGGDGNDRLDASQTNVKIYANGGNGNDTMRGGNNTDILNGGEGNDAIRGGNNNDTLRGGNGNDILVGDKGSDFFDGGWGDDRMIWNDGDGSDTMRGGIGKDVTEFNGSVAQGDDLILKADGGKAIFQRLNLVPITLDVDDTEQFEINGIGGDDTLNVKDLAATDVQQVKFTGGDGNDRLDASQTNVKIYADGGNGNDTLIGGTNDDTLIGGEGSDFLNGGGGNDVLNAGSINPAATGVIDTLTGGNGGDRYVLTNGTSVYYNDGNNATAGLNDYALIQGFNTSQDKIQLQGAASKYVLGSSPISGISGTGIYVDTNGNGILGPNDELISVVTGVTNLNLTAGYFTYI
jgi:Ca2+-binding RTX toxin-like protein